MSNGEADLVTSATLSKHAIVLRFKDHIVIPCGSNNRDWTKTDLIAEDFVGKPYSPSFILHDRLIHVCKIPVLWVPEDYGQAFCHDYFMPRAFSKLAPGALTHVKKSPSSLELYFSSGLEIFFNDPDSLLRQNTGKPPTEYLDAEIHKVEILSFYPTNGLSIPSIGIEIDPKAANLPKLTFTRELLGGKRDYLSSPITVRDKA